jgi:rod shape determining protein RodA
MFFTFSRSVDWILLVGALLLSAAGLVTMNSFIEPNTFFDQQIIWLFIALAVFLGATLVDWRFLRNTWVVVTLFAVSVLSLLLLFLFGSITMGAQSRFDLGLFFIQPSDPAKLVLIIILAKYFARRHVEIAHIRHIFVSGAYAFLFFILLFVQPDFGGAIVVFLLWLGMVLVSGISKKHLALVFLAGSLTFMLLWNFAFQDYQKARIITFLNPLTDIHGAGYNSYQSTITVGSGQLLGKGIGFGTQSRLRFLPEYETDFIFGAFSEEWGFIGVLFLLACFALVLWRIMRVAFLGATNFETLFAVGIALSIVAPATIHIGMNIGLLPVTGTVLPFVSYGGSHLVIEFLSLGILSGMQRYQREVHRELSV